MQSRAVVKAHEAVSYIRYCLIVVGVVLPNLLLLQVKECLHNPCQSES